MSYIGKLTYRGISKLHVPSIAFTDSLQTINEKGLLNLRIDGVWRFIKKIRSNLKIIVNGRWGVCFGNSWKGNTGIRRIIE